jgi:DNA-binding NtrC family response regulator
VRAKRYCDRMSTRPPDVATQPNEPRSVARPSRLFLQFVYPRELAGVTVELSKGTVFGREPPGAGGSDSEVAPGTGSYTTVPHPTVSRRHATVQHAFAVPILTDLGSSNGTRVDGKLIREPTPLVAQSVVRFGDTLAVVDEQVLESGSELARSIPGNGPAMTRVRTLVVRAAPESAAMLILGETGTGKEWLAAALHERSGRSGPYLKLSCAELSPHLVESELFGHERGAFTGAVARHTGLFQAANDGTLFLDEIGDLPLDLQAKLLRVLQEGEVRPLGSTQTYRTDVRVVSATNVDLALAVDEGRFRRDLYARLSVFEVRLPPLRQRRQDILGWLHRFWDRASEERGKTLTLGLQPGVAERIVMHGWPDNLRGLERLVQRLQSMSTDVTVGMSLLGELMPELASRGADSGLPPSGDPAPVAPRAPQAAPSAAPSAAAGDAPEREEFLRVYEASGRSVRATSKHFGRDRRQIYRWLEAFGIDRPKSSKT